MENAVLVGLSRQIALARELDVIANNVANVQTNGFKARSMRFEEFLRTNARGETFPTPDKRVSFVVDTGTPIDMSTGAIERTGNPLDAAIKGDGFFVVRTPTGERFTRNGSFELNSRGEMVNSDGHTLLGESGPIAFGPTETGIAIGADGTVTSNLGQRGKIRLVRFDNPQVLRNEGQNVFSATVAPQPAGTAARIEAGALERSNVKPILEMSRLIEVNRAYTSLANMITKADELRRTAIQRLSDTTN